MSLEKSLARRLLEARNTKLSAGAPKPKESASGPKLGEVYRDPRFHAMLEQKNDPRLTEMQARVLRGEETEDDVKEALVLRGEFLERNARAERLKTAFGSDIGSLRGASPDLDRLCGAVGEEAFTGVFQQWLGDLAFRDPAEFERIEGMHAKMAEARAVLDNPDSSVNKSLATFRAKHKLDDQFIEKLVREPDEDRRTHMVQAELRRSMNFFEKMGDRLRVLFDTDSTVSIARGANDAIQNLEKAGVNERESAQELSGLIVALSTGNEDVRRALMQAAKGEKVSSPRSIERTTLGFDAAREGVAQVENADRMRDEYIAYITRDCNMPLEAYDALPEDEQEQMFTRFYDGEPGAAGYVERRALTTGEKRGILWNALAYLAGILRTKLFTQTNTALRASIARI